MGFQVYSLLVYTLTFPNDPNKTPGGVVNDTIRVTSESVPQHSLHNFNPIPSSHSSSKTGSPLHSIILSTNCVTHMRMFPLSPDGWMNEKVYASPDIPISSSSPIVRLWFSSSPTVLNVDDDPCK
jgi:hypothetical protein